MIVGFVDLRCSPPLSVTSGDKDEEQRGMAVMSAAAVCFVYTQGISIHTSSRPGCHS